MNQLRAYVTEIKRSYGDKDIHLLLEMLSRTYCEYNPIDNDAIQNSFHDLESCLEHLPSRENDQVFDRVCALCVEYEKAAFLEGMRVGAQLVMELNGSV